MGDKIMTRRNRRSRNQIKKNNNKIVLMFIMAIILLICGLSGSNTENLSKASNNLESNIESGENQDKIENSDSQLTVDSNLEVYFIDVGQADSILVLNNTQAMLIDAGNNEDGEKVVDFIKDKEIQTLNYVIRHTST